MSRNNYIWRWWDGTGWRASKVDPEGPMAALYMEAAGDMEWTDYWPKHARVPRVDPAHPYITPLLPMLNTGNKYAWEFAGKHALRYREPISMPKPDPDLCVPKIDAATCTSQEMPEARAEPAPTPEEDEAWRAFSTGQAQTPGARELAGVSTLALMKEIFRRFQE